MQGCPHRQSINQTNKSNQSIIQNHSDSDNSNQSSNQSINQSINHQSTDQPTIYQQKQPPAIANGVQRGDATLILAAMRRSTAAVCWLPKNTDKGRSRCSHFLILSQLQLESSNSDATSEVERNQTARSRVVSSVARS